MLREKYLLLNNIKDIEPILFRYLTFIAGGAITSIFSSTKINDYDIYFKYPMSEIKIKEMLYELEGFNYNVKCKSDNAISLEHTATGTKLQLIVKENCIGKPKDVIKMFDFTICKAYYDFETEELYLGEDFLRHLAEKRLVLSDNLIYPLSTLFRTKKYTKKGYVMSAVDYIKLGLSINNLKIESFKDLREHIIAIDTMFLKALTDKMLENTECYDYKKAIEWIENYIDKHYGGEIF